MGLENRRSGNVSEGSNPSLSAIFPADATVSDARISRCSVSVPADDDGTEVGTGDSLYFVKDASGPIKIGRGKDPSKRVSLFQTGNPNDLKLIAAVEGVGYLEPFWHVCFSGFNVRGEWFRPEPALLAAIDAIRDGRDWTDHVPMIHHNAWDLGEWQEHMLDALDAYLDTVWDLAPKMTQRSAAIKAIYCSDFDGFCVTSRLAFAYEGTTGQTIIRHADGRPYPRAEAYAARDATLAAIASARGDA